MLPVHPRHLRVRALPHVPNVRREGDSNSQSKRLEDRQPTSPSTCTKLPNVSVMSLQNTCQPKRDICSKARFTLPNLLSVQIEIFIETRPLIFRLAGANNRDCAKARYDFAR